jgi:hypothetical protein
MGSGYWDLWVSGEVIATVSRLATRWHGTYYGDERPRQEFTSTPQNSCNPQDIKAQIEDYITAPVPR